MIKTIFLFYIYCVNAEPRYLRHLSYATGMERPQYLRHLEFATGMEGQHRYLRQPELYEDIEEFTDIYESNY
jgi:hypothetical protein